MLTFLFCPSFNSIFTHSLLGQICGTRNMKEMEELHCLGSLEFSGRNSECEKINRMVWALVSVYTACKSNGGWESRHLWNREYTVG